MLNKNVVDSIADKAKLIVLCGYAFLHYQIIR
jgi:hypothetical protein